MTRRELERQTMLSLVGMSAVSMFLLGFIVGVGLSVWVLV